MDRRPSYYRPEDPKKHHCLPLAHRGASALHPLSLLGSWASRSLRRARFLGLRKPGARVAFEVSVDLDMEDVKQGDVDDHGFNGIVVQGETFSELVEDESQGSSSSSSSEESPKQSATQSWAMQSSIESHLVSDEEKSQQHDERKDELKPHVSEIEMMKERFAKLLLGEDMSGSGKGVCTALAISNAITNLCATIFGQLWRLEPLTPEKKSMWRREMEWLLCVSNHIVELIPTWQTCPNGSKLEVMTCRPRSDLYASLPALRKLDNMLLEILDGFSNPEFRYVDQGILATDSDGSASFRRALQRQEEKWWLPVPHVPPGGLHEQTRKQLQHKRECTNQILKAAMAINSNALAEMEVPESYLDSLPKNGRACLGDAMYRYITSDQFYPECLLNCLDPSSEHQALEIANHVEASIYVWRGRAFARPMDSSNRANLKSSWGVVKDMITDAEKRELLADRAECLLLCLKQRFPCLAQTTLDTSKIQFNKDVGKSILESYSRVLESLAFNIVARIDDLLYVDELSRHSDRFSSVPTVSVARKNVPFPYSVSVAGTPYASAYSTPNFSPTDLSGPIKGERTPFISRKSHSRGFGVKKVLTDYLGVEVRGKNNSDVVEVSEPLSSMNLEDSAGSAHC